MFEWLFKYPPTVYLHGQLVLRSAWPRWPLLLGVVAVGVVLAWALRGRRASDTRATGRWRLPLIWLVQWAMAALVLLLLWRPAIAVGELVPQANVIAVLVDDSHSMAIADRGITRMQQASQALQGAWLASLGRTFQTRLYRFDSSLVRLQGPAATLTANGPATHISSVLNELANDTASVPVGAVVLLSDGGDNTGRIDRNTIEVLRQRRIPVHTVGFGSPQVPRDIEIESVALTDRALAHSRVTAVVEVSQSGFATRRTSVTVRDAEKLLATRELVLGADGATVSTDLTFDLPEAGPRLLRFQVAPLAGEGNARNNELTRLVNVESGPRRILYVEGEPRWEYKFIRRAEEDDAAVQMVSMLRTTENKIYRQGVKDAMELAQGFPTKPEELFGFDGLVIGSVDAGYFSAAQQTLMREFVSRRGGGLLFLGGRQSLADGVWSGSQLNDLLPVTLPMINGTFHREPATVSLTTAGADSAITRLVDDRAANLTLWSKLPYLMDFQDPGKVKPGASELAQMQAGGRTLPLLVTESYGRGRTAVLATGGTWRWQMSLPLGDPTHSVFWHQVLHWLVSETRGQLGAQVSAGILQDDGHVQLQADVRDKNYLPAADAVVNAHVIGPDRLQADVSLRAVPGLPGRYQSDWTAPAVGTYVADITANQGVLSAGHDTIAFQRQDGVAENFHTGQNVALLKSLAADTGGRYWSPDDLDGLAHAIPFSNAGVSVQKFQDLWNMPAVFLMLVLLRMGEWLLRRAGEWYDREQIMSRRARWQARCLVRCLALGPLLGAATAHADIYYVNVAGLGGEPDYEQRFAALASDLDRIANGGGASAHVVTLSGAQATREHLQQALVDIAGTAHADDVLIVTLVGHGSFDGTQYKFNIPGPDLSAEQLADWCDHIPATRQLIVNTTSASGGSVKALQRHDRVVIAATKAGTEKNATVFARYWVEALQDPGADVDKNQIITGLEAFQYAARKTAAFYETEKRLATEHAIFEEGGKAAPVRDAAADGDAGRMLASFALVRLGGDSQAATDPAKLALLKQKEQLEQKIDLLKYQRAAMSPEDYRTQLSQTLVALAKVQQELDK